jgi:hypothetical protein
LLGGLRHQRSGRGGHEHGNGKSGAHRSTDAGRREDCTRF